MDPKGINTHGILYHKPRKISFFNKLKTCELRGPEYGGGHLRKCNEIVGYWYYL